MARRNLAQAASWQGSIRARTWLILDGLAFAVFGLLVWAGIALLSVALRPAPKFRRVGRRPDVGFEFPRRRRDAKGHC